MYHAPFYIFDEIDAFLDTRTALRVGNMIKSASKERLIQFIVVSHHPEVQIAASRMIGLYFSGWKTVSVSMGF